MDLLALTRAADCLPPCAAEQPSAWLYVGLFWAACVLVVAGFGVWLRLRSAAEQQLYDDCALRRDWTRADAHARRAWKGQR